MSHPTHAIGDKGLIPWHIPEDFKRFKELTFNKPVIMGRKTFESINKAVRPLPGRLNIVLTKSEAAQEQIESDYEMFVEDTNTGLLVSDDLGRGILAAEVEGKVNWDTSEIFIIGGESLYYEALEHKFAEKMYLTYIEQEIHGDTHFPVFSRHDWEHKLVGGPSNHAGLDYTFWEYTASWAQEKRVVTEISE
jgi:dihydrofolate reductase